MKIIVSFIFFQQKLPLCILDIVILIKRPQPSQLVVFVSSLCCSTSLSCRESTAVHSHRSGNNLMWYPRLHTNSIKPNSWTAALGGRRYFRGRVWSLLTVLSWVQWREAPSVPPCLLLRKQDGQRSSQTMIAAEWLERGSSSVCDCHLKEEDRKYRRLPAGYVLF